MRAPLSTDPGELQTLALSAADATLRAAAIRRLAVLDGAEHLETFRAVLAEPVVTPVLAVAAVRALVRAGPGAEPDLIARLSVPDPRIRRAVVATLTEVGGQAALEALMAAPAEGSPALTRRLVFARRVVAHRIRSADTIPATDTTFAAIPATDPVPVSTEVPAVDDRARFLRHLRNQSFGLSPDSGTLSRLFLDGVPHFVIFDRALSAPEFRRSLSGRPAILGLVAEESHIDGLPSVVDCLILSEPAPNPALTVWCRTGEPLLSGAMEIDGDRVTARLDRHAPAGGVALALTLRAAGAGTALSELSAARVPGGTRLATALEAPA